MEPPFVYREHLRSWLYKQLATQVNDKALNAIEHSMRCVMAQHVRAARYGIRKHVMALLASNDFEGLPTLEPRHFLPTYQRLNQFGQVAERGYEPGPRVWPRR